MNAYNAPAGIRRLSTADLPEPHRLQMAHDMYVRTIFKHELKPMGDQPFRFSARLYSLPGLGVGSVSVTPCRTWHPTESGRDDDVLFNLTLRGGRHVAQRGRELTLSAGDAVLATIDPAVTTMRASQFLSFRLKRSELGPLTADLDACLLRPIRSNFALRLLPGYVSALEEAMQANADTQELVVAHVYDLIAMTLGAGRNAAELVAERGVRAARLLAIKNDILANLGDDSLSISAVATRQGITPRYVAMLFDGAGSSFSGFVLEQRLARARRMLTTPRYRGRTISAIAYACGFGDLSYFNKAFRRTFGATPSEVRATRHEYDD